MIQEYLGSDRKNFFEVKLKPMLMYVGTLGSILMSIAYIIVVFVMIYGFKSDMKLASVIVFAITNAIVGCLIMFLLKLQGKDFAKNLEENKPIIKAYYGTKTKNKPIRSIKYFWITSTIKDVLTKAVTVFITTSLVIKIVIEGNGDLTLLLMAIFNLIMFICFGFVSLVNAYDFYNEFHVPYMIEELNKVGKQIKIDDKEVIENGRREEIISKHPATSGEE